MNEALRELVDGPSEQRMLIGLLVAAGGGLTTADLAGLSGRPPRALMERLNMVAGRAFDRRLARWTGPDAYLLGHEELHRAALAEIGPGELVRYRQRLHEWAARYRERGLATGTPEYLLSGYVSMLLASGDLDRAVRYVTDRARQERMLDVSGGDAAARAEITTTLRRLAEQADPDLSLIGCLAVHRDHLTVRNGSIPSILPAVWAITGQVSRAENLAWSIPSRPYRLNAITELIREISLRGEHDRVRQLAAEIEGVAFDSPFEAASVWASLSVSVARTGDQGWARRLAAASEDCLAAVSRARSHKDILTDLAEAAGLTQDVAEARRLVDQGVSLVSTHHRGDRAELLAKLAKIMGSIGDQEAARRLALAAEANLSAATGCFAKMRAYAALIRAVALTGDAQWRQRLTAAAEGIIYGMADIPARAELFDELVQAAVAAGDEQNARRLAAEAARLAPALTVLVDTTPAGVERPFDVRYAERRIWALTEVAAALAVTGEVHQAEWLATETERLVRGIRDPDDRARILAGLASALTPTSDRAWAVRLTADISLMAGDVTGLKSRMQVLAALAKAVTTTGDRPWADRLAAEAEALARIPLESAHVGAAAVQVASAAGDQSRAVRLAAWTERHLPNLFVEQEAHELAANMAVAVAVSGDHREARRLATAADKMASSPSTLSDDDYGRLSQVRVLATLAEAMAATGDHQKADRFAARAEKLASTVTDGCLRARVQAYVVAAMAASGNWARVDRLAEEAESLIRDIAGLEEQATELARLVKAVMIGTAGAPAKPAVERSPWARHLLADCLRLGRWTIAMPVLAQVCPPAAVAIADEARIVHQEFPIQVEGDSNPL